MEPLEFAPFAGVVALACALALRPPTAVQRLTGGLNYFFVPAVDKEEESSRASRKASNRELKERAAAREVATSSIARIQLVPQVLAARPLFESLDLIAFFASLLACESLASVAGALVFNTHSALTPTMSVVGLLLACKCLLDAHRDRTITPPVERQLALLVAFVGWALAVFVVFLAPATAVDFSLVGLANDANDILRNLTGAEVRVSVLHVGLAFAFISAAVSGLLFAGSSRIVKAYLMATACPQWCKEYASSAKLSPLRKFLLQTTFASPMVILIASSPGMCFAADANSVEIQAVSLVACGALFFAAVRPLTQAHLDGGLIAWYEIKEGDAENENLTEAQRSAIERKLNVTSHIVVKVALQFAAPALAFASCGVGAWAYSLRASVDASARINMQAMLTTGWFLALWTTAFGALAFVLNGKL